MNFRLTFATRSSGFGAIANDEVPHALAKFDIAVAPYPQLDDFYFSPLKILEYMAAELPIIASDIGQIPQLIEREMTGVLVDPGVVDDLANAILRLCTDVELRNRIATNARAKAVAQHTWQHVLEQILETVSTTSALIEVCDGTS